MANKTLIATLTGDTFVPESVGAISYVGGRGAGRAGSTSTVNVAINSGLTGGSGSVALAGDLVIVTVAVGSQGRNPSCAVSGYTALTQQNTTATTYDISVCTSYKFMPATPDTTVTIPATGNIADGQAYRINVFRGVDPSTPLDGVTPAYSTGSGTNNRPDPASITPATAGAWIYFGGGGAAATGTTLFTAAYLTNFVSHNGPDTNDGTVGSGYYTGWSSGAYDGAAWGGGSVNAANSWGCTALVLRPYITTPFNDARQTAIDGIDSAQSEAHGWDVEKVNIPVTALVRTSDTVITLTIPSLPNYDITAQETIEWTIPAAIITGGVAVVATPTWTIDEAGSGRTANLAVTLAGCVVAAAATLAATVVLAVQLAGASVGSGATVPTVADLGASLDGASVASTVAAGSKADLAVILSGASVDSGTTAGIAIATGVQLDGAGISAEASVPVVADASVQLAGASVAATGAVGSVAVLAVDLAGATLSANASSTTSRTADLGVTLAGATVASATTAPVVAAASIPLAGASVGAGATAPVVADVGINLAGAGLSSGVTIPVEADLAGQLSDTTLSADATSTNARNIDLCVQLAGATVGTETTVNVAAALAKTLAGATATSEGVVGIEADASVALADASCSADASGPVVADSGVILADAVLSSGATAPVVADVAAALEGATLSSDAAQGIVRTADLSVDLEGAALSADGSVAVEAGLSVVLVDSNVISIATARKRAALSGRDSEAAADNAARRWEAPQTRGGSVVEMNAARKGKTPESASARRSTYRQSSQRGR